MRNKYPAIRFPEEARDGFLIKKSLIEEKIKRLTGKRKRIPMTEVLRFFANRKITVYDEELIKHFFKKKNRRAMLI